MMKWGDLNFNYLKRIIGPVVNEKELPVSGTSPHAVVSS